MVDKHCTTLTRRRLLAVFAGAILVRLLMLTIALTRGGFTLSTLANARDGLSYTNYARYMLGETKAITQYDLRVFPGFPALIAAVHFFGVPAHLAGLILNMGAIAGAAVLCALLFRDIRFGWAIATLPPSLALYATYVMSEPTLLFFAILGTWLVVRHATVPIGGRIVPGSLRATGAAFAGGLSFGIAGAIRPVACFAVAGTMLHAIRHRRWRIMLLHAVCALCIVSCTILFLRFFLGDPLSGVKTYASHSEAYAGHLFGWPIQSIITSTLSPETPRLFKAYIWSYILAVLFANLIVLTMPWRSAAKKRALPDEWWWVTPWLCGNTLFVLCVGSYWGFAEFHRFILPALPPLLWCYRGLLPRRIWMWVIIGAASIAVASYHCKNENESNSASEVSAGVTGVQP